MRSVNSAVFVGGDTPQAERAGRLVASKFRSTRRMRRRFGRPTRRQASLSADGKWRAQARESAARAGRRSRPARISRSVMRRDSKAARSTGCASSRTARTIRRPIRALRPAAEIAITAARRRPAARRSRHSACAPRTWRGIRMDRRSRSPPTRTGRTNRHTNSPTSTP